VPYQASPEALFGERWVTEAELREDHAIGDMTSLAAPIQAVRRADTGEEREKTRCDPGHLGDQIDG